MTNHISFQNYDKNLMAIASSKNLPISRKFSIEILDAIRNKKVDYAIKYLENVMAMKQPVSLKKFIRNVAHKPGMMAGRFPVKAALHIKKIVESAQKNAIDKGFSNDLIITHATACRGNTVHHYGRNYGRRAKACHIEIAVREASQTEKSKAGKAKVKKQKTEKTDPTQEATK